MMRVIRPIKTASRCTLSWQMGLEFVEAGISDRSLAVLILICCPLYYKLERAYTQQTLDIIAPRRALLVS
jgi:hypothetical protein